MPFDMVECGQRVMEARTMQGLTQSELAGIADISQQDICRMERGERFPSLENAITLANVLKVDLEWLCCQQDMMRRATDIEW